MAKNLKLVNGFLSCEWCTCLRKEILKIELNQVIWSSNTKIESFVNKLKTK